jgi:leucyl/phenylalanyl-tRNA--protein transferase
MAGKDGLIAVGGNLLPETLIDAYHHGIFPWPTGDVLAWWSPDPRAVLEFDRLHISQRLRRTLRSKRFELTSDRDFAGVIHGCATAQHRARGTWITPALRSAYERMHHLGYAHSIEAWRDDQLVGGVYGIGMGAMFAAESMFYTQRDASKVALVHLVRHLQSRGYLLLDIQQLTPHTARLGASEIPRPEFLQRLSAAISRPVTFGRKLTILDDNW